MSPSGRSRSARCRRATCRASARRATQPVPTKPPPFAKQGFTEDDVIDFTPELKWLALEEITEYRVGPLYTPPSLEGTIVMPGAIGGGGWGGGAFDPATGMMYIKATNEPALFKLFPVGRRPTRCRRGTWWSWVGR